MPTGASRRGSEPSRSERATDAGFTRLRASRHVLAMALAVLAATGGAGCGDGRDAPETAAVDSSLVHILVDLHLADARGAVHADPALGDSLRDLVYEAHGLDSTQLDQRLADTARRPGAVDALTEAVETQLTTERQTTSPLP